MGVPVQHGGRAPDQGRIQLFAPGLRVPIQRCDIHLRRQIDGGLAENLQILPALPGLLVDGRKGHGAPPSPASSAGRLGHRTTGRAKSPLPPRSMRGENPQLTNLPRRGYNMFQSDDGEGRRPAPSESRRAVEAGGKGLQVLWLLSRGFEGGAPPVGPLRGLPRQGRGVAGPQKGRRAVRTAQFEWYRGSLTAFVSKFFFGTKAVFSSPKSSSSSRKEHTP